MAEESGSTMQESGSGTVVDSGALLQMQIDALKEMAGNRLPESSSALQLPAAKLSAWQSDLARYVEKSADYRATCSDTIRRANRDTIVKQANTCMRGDLLLHVSFLRKQQTYVESLPLLSDAVRSEAVTAIKNLIDAEMTIVGAIDAGIYEQTAALDDAKVKLRTQYRAPYWLALTKVRADRQLTYIGLVLKKLMTISTDPDTTPDLQNAIASSLSCLTTAAEPLGATVAAVDLQTAGKSLSEATIHISSCRKAIRDSFQPQTPEPQNDKENP